MNDPQLTSADPAAKTSLSGAIDFAIRKALQAIDGQLPAQIIRYDRETNRAVVMPLISRLTVSGEIINRAPIASVPVLALGGGGFNISFPLKPGDKGWIEASDRDISLFLQSSEVEKPNTLRIHEFADGRFIPDVFSDYTLPAEHEGKLIIQSTSGDVAISLSSNEMEITAPKLTVNSASVEINGHVEINGSLKINGLNFSTHIHSDVSPGNGVTGGPK